MKVTSREKSLIMIAVATLAAILIFYAITMLVPDAAVLSQNVELKKRMLRNQLETLSQEESYKASLDQYQKQLDLDLKRFLPGDNPSLASADLQKTLKDFADKTGVEIAQRNALPEKKASDIVTKVSVRIETNCTPEQLVQFLSLIENYEKMLRVDEAIINSLRISKKFEIRPSLTISGYIRTQEEKPKEKTETG
jgi:hypothetical protein